MRGKDEEEPHLSWVHGPRSGWFITIARKGEAHMPNAPASEVERIQAIDLDALRPALEEAVLAQSYDLALDRIERNEATELRVHYAFPHPDAEEQPPRAQWITGSVAIDTWKQHDFEDEGRSLLGYDDGELDEECDLVTELVEQIEDERSAVPPIEEYVPAAPAPTDEPLADVDLDDLLLKLKGDIADAYDGTVRLQGLDRDETHVTVRLEVDPTQDGAWSPGRVRVAWQGGERFRHDALEAMGPLVAGGS